MLRAAKITAMSAKGRRTSAITSIRVKMIK
jgi:hypothetical protein